MSHQPLTCHADRIAAYLADAMDAQEQSAFESHLEQCEICRETLDRSVATAQDWDDLQSSLADVAGTLDFSGDADGRQLRAASEIDFCKKLLGPTDDPRMLGRIGNYEIVGILGRGGMGIVFKAFDPSLNRYVAIKMLTPMFSSNGASRQRFLREAQSAAAVVHDHVVPIHGISQWQDTPYLVMALVRGESLQKRLSQRGALPIRELLRIGRQVALGLAAAHAQGLIHRDIKPANILLDSDVDRARITDFGLARAVDDIRLTRTDMLLGTPQYMSPEQARDELLDFRTDLFSLGVVLYEAATCRAPFHAATSYGTLRKIVEHDPPSIRRLNPDIPPWFDQVVGKLMAKNPADRFQTATEVSSLLEQCLAHVEQPHLVSLPAAISSRKKRNPLLNWRIAMFAAMSACLVTAGWLLFAAVESKNSPSASQNKESTVHVSTNETGDEDGREMPSTTAGPHKITVRKVEDVSKMKMNITHDFSKLRGGQNLFSKSINLGDENGNATATVGTSVGGGGLGGAFVKPNLGIALSIRSKGSNSDEKDVIVELSPDAEAIDDEGRTLKGIGDGPQRVHFREFESTVSGDPVLYLSGRKRDAQSIEQLKGKLLVTPGRVTTATFEGPKFATGKAKKSDGKSFTLQSVQSDSNGVQFTVLCPATQATLDASTPQERIQAIIDGRGTYTAEIVDDEGEIHAASSSASGSVAGPGGTFGNSSSSNHQFSTSNSKVSSSSSEKTESTLSPDGSVLHSFQFSPLPEGREIKSIRVRMTERTGPTKSINFTLKDIPLN